MSKTMSTPYEVDLLNTVHITLTISRTFPSHNGDTYFASIKVKTKSCSQIKVSNVTLAYNASCNVPYMPISKKRRLTNNHSNS